VRLLLLTNEGKWSGRVEYDCDLFLIGFRELLGGNAVDFPKRELLYKRWTLADKQHLYGRGFTILSKTLPDILDRSLSGQFDHVLYLGPRCERYPQLHDRAGGPYFEIRHDARTAHKQCTPLPMPLQGQLPEESPVFRWDGAKVRNLFAEHQDWPALPLGIPRHLVRPLHFDRDLVHQRSLPVEGGGQSPYPFTNEKDYYAELSRCWFGLICRKQRWDSLRLYEMLAMGACVVFKNYDRKPPRAAPAQLPCFSVRDYAEVSRLYAVHIRAGKPSNEYLDMVQKQREWLLNNTVDKVAGRVLEWIEKG